VSDIDLNCDLGEGPGEDAIYPCITSANIACGGHAGDDASMEAAVRQSLAHGVALGAHPSYPDREGFGRVALAMTPGELAEAVRSQVLALARIATRSGAILGHVKPHGALYGEAMKDAAIAEAVARGVALHDPGLVLVGLAGSPALELWRALGFAVAGEGFADRAYEPDGSLRSRRLPGALITEPAEAAAQALRLARDGPVDTICVHSDTPGAARILAEVRRVLAGRGFLLRPLRG
jgi:5-oxoprolinase (ATP-hydrolysing) subunit A